MIRNVTRVAENVKLLNNKIKLNYTNNYNLKALFQQHATKMIDGDRNTTKNVQWWVMRRLNSSATNEEEKKQRNNKNQKDYAKSIIHMEMFNFKNNMSGTMHQQYQNITEKSNLPCVRFGRKAAG